MSFWQFVTSVAQPPWASGFMMHATQADDGGQPMLPHTAPQFADDCTQPTKASATEVAVPGHTERLQLSVPARPDARNSAHWTQLPESPAPPLLLPELEPLPELLPELLPLEPPLPELPPLEPEELHSLWQQLPKPVFKAV